MKRDTTAGICCQKKTPESARKLLRMRASNLPRGETRPKPHEYHLERPRPTGSIRAYSGTRSSRLGDSDTGAWRLGSLWNEFCCSDLSLTDVGSFLAASDYVADLWSGILLISFDRQYSERSSYNHVTKNCPYEWLFALARFSAICVLYSCFVGIGKSSRTSRPF